MPFDPQRGGNVGFGGYANPYAAPPSNHNKSKKPNYILFIMVGILILGIITGVLVFMKNSSNVQNQNPNGSTQVDKSDYVEVEIFDVQQE